ncbi:diguanylate cyclase [Rhodanobacter sp. AS-Z3]|uniref:ligand-binding sensor domain-containing diguanylate cyclase n=1 Tax=Rhodanobacter sp. AS-Z3 TaxID=3031330 RepID=UPI00247A4EFF|nr:ligand-binding sensor domain-containing diguanylate cyclase [Rhodanobacter sp. AS-Z3]WEN15166.1 diguanylate cyclase [Rhodanobacter sp. AS-Z3]
MIDQVTRKGAVPAWLAIAFGLMLCVFGLSSAVAMNPQQPFHSYVLDHWSVEQGLPQITALDMAEDRAGFLWINTQIAVARFDGTLFVKYDRATTGVDTSMLSVAWADPKAGMWFGGAHGLLRELDGRFSALGGPAVNAIIDAGNGTPLLATSDGLARVQHGTVVPLDGHAGAAFSLLRDGQSLWVGGTGRVCRADDSSSPAVSNCIRADPAQQDAFVSHLAMQGGQLWLGTQVGLMHVKGDRLVPAALGQGLDTTSIESLLTDRQGVLWIGTVEALYRRLPDGTVERVGEEDIMQRPWVQALFEDRGGNLWLGTHARGIYRVWNGWTRRVSLRDGVTDPLVWSVLRSAQGQIVLGTNSGVEVFDGEHVHPLISGSALPNPSAYMLRYDQQDRLWVGTRAGIAVFEQGRDVTPAAFSALRSWRIDDIREVAADDFWIGTSGGLYRWHQGILSRADPGASTAAATIRAILPLAPDHLYLGTEDGVREWHDGKLTEPAWAKSLNGRFVSYLDFVKPGVLGVATGDAGIGVMTNGRLRMLSQKDGLPSDNVWTFNVVGDYLYAGSVAGAWRLPLSQLPLSDARVHSVSPQRLAGEERVTTTTSLHCCNGGASTRSVVDGDYIWYSTTDGILRLDTRAVGAMPITPAAAVVSVEHEGKLFSGQSFTLDEGARDLTISYTAPHLAVGTLRFRYRLDGYDTDWQNADLRREAFYTHLPAGNYRFRVAAMLPGAAGYGPEAAIVIQISPYWYERLVTRAVALVILCLLVFLLIRWSMRRQRRRNAWLEEQVERRTVELSRALERLRVTNLALAQESYTDTLTGLPNRRFLMARLPPLLSPDTHIGVLQIDIDYFKQINDTYGHAVGDSVLRELGEVLSASRRESDITVRWGGEEFLLLLRDIDAQGVLVIAERLRGDIAAKKFDNGRGGILRLTCSIGYSMHPLAARADESTFDVAVELADFALYRAKSLGRNRSVGLLVTAPLAEAILHDPLAPQLDTMLAANQLKWMLPAS